MIASSNHIFTHFSPCQWMENATNFLFFTIWSIKGFEGCNGGMRRWHFVSKYASSNRNVHVKMGELWRHVVQHSCSISIFVNQIAPLAFIPFNLTIFNKSWNWTASHLEQVNRTCDQIFEHMLESRLSLVAFRSKYTVAVDSSSKLLTLLNKYFQHYWDVSKGCSSPPNDKDCILTVDQNIVVSYSNRWCTKSVPNVFSLHANWQELEMENSSQELSWALLALLEICSKMSMHLELEFKSPRTNEKRFTIRQWNCHFAYSSG